MHFSGIVPRYLQLSHYARNLQVPIESINPDEYESTSIKDSWTGIDKFVEDTLKEWHAPGMAVAIINGDKIEAKGYGLASVDPPRPVTNSTLFFAGSTTKSFTAAALSLLIDDKEKFPDLQWSTTIKSLIPEEFVTEDEYATNHLTLEDFLSHRSGYGRHEVSWPGKSIKEVVHNYRYLPRATEMRTKFEYCNLGFMAISYIIEKLTGQWLGDFFTERLWKPMGMNSTFLSLKDALKSDNDLAHAYHYSNETSEYVELPWVDTLEGSGAGLAISNVLDYARYIRIMMNREAPISARGHEALMTPRSIMGPLGADVFNGPMLYSLGWMQSNYHGERLTFHGGALEGFLAHMAYFPDKKWGLVTMTNMGSHAQDIVVYHLLDEFLGVPLEQRKNLSSIAKEVDKAIKRIVKILPDLIYPDVPSPPLSLSLPLDNYTGTYHHPAYSNITLYRNCSSSLSSSNCDAPLESLLFPSGVFFKFGLVLKHVSGDYFLAMLNEPQHKDATEPVGVVKAKFEIDATGVVQKFGIDIRMEGLDTPLIWFDKVE